MKNILTLIVVLIMSVANSVAQINTELYERKVLAKLNKYRTDNGLDTFVDYNMVRTVAKMEFDFEVKCSNCGDNPKFNSNMQKVLGMNVYKSYNAKIVDFWDLNNLIIGNDVEEVLSSEVVKYFLAIQGIKLFFNNNLHIILLVVSIPILKGKDSVNINEFFDIFLLIHVAPKLTPISFISKFKFVKWLDILIL